MSELVEKYEDLLKAATIYANRWLQDERDDPGLCFGTEHHEAICALFAAIERLRDR